MARSTKTVAAPVIDILTIRAANITAYVDAQFSYESTTKSVREAAADLLRGVALYAEVEKIRDALKEAYIARQLLGGSTQEKAKDAANMFWSRTVARAKDEGVTLPEKPVTQAATDAKVKREAAREEKAKKAYNAARAAGASEAVAKAMAEQAVDGRKQKTAAPKSPIVQDEMDDDLRVVFDWAQSDESHKTILLKWFEAITKASRKAA
jgi:hypothetical protein